MASGLVPNLDAIALRVFISASKRLAPRTVRLFATGTRRIHLPPSWRTSVRTTFTDMVSILTAPGGTRQEPLRGQRVASPESPPPSPHSERATTPGAVCRTVAGASVPFLTGGAGGWIHSEMSPLYSVTRSSDAPEPDPPSVAGAVRVYGSETALKLVGPLHHPSGSARPTGGTGKPGGRPQPQLGSTVPR
jgi:hypothetical protein